MHNLDEFLNGPRKKLKDWSLPENRLELFKRYFRWRILSHDLDHVHYMKVLTSDYDYERKAWFSFCFGMTYRTPQAFAYTETFPYINSQTIEEMEEWHKLNWKRTTYGTDARYNKGHFIEQTKSILKWLDGKTFKEKIDSIITSEDSKINFENLYREILSLYKYGRMTGWLTMQALHDLLDLNIDPKRIMILGYSPKNDSSLGSIWNGLCALENTPEKMVGKYGNYSPTQEDCDRADKKLMEYTSMAEEHSGFRIDSFRKESIWCQYKRLFHEESSREFPGHASSDATSRYLYYREHWPEIDWSKFRLALRQQPGLIKGMVGDKSFDKLFGQTQQLLNLHELYSDMDDLYEIEGIDVNQYTISEIWTDDNLEVPIKDSSKSTFMEDLKTTPKYYEPIL